MLSSFALVTWTVIPSFSARFPWLKLNIEFANSNINERCPITPLWDIKAKQQSLQEIKADVIDPLLRQKVPEPFRGDLNDVDSKVSRGLLTNVREVEARLISNGRVNKSYYFLRTKKLICASSIRLVGKSTKDT